MSQHQYASAALTSAASAAPTIFPNSSSELGMAKLGWVNQPNQRGTVDIIWSCVVTLGVCVWAMLHLNVPAKKDRKWAIFLRRLRWMTLAILASELVMLFACGQWTSAQRWIAEMQGLGFTERTMIHAYYADAGGFLLHSEDFASCPITAKQVHYFIQQGHIPRPRSTRKMIWDKSKADLFAKTIASSQAAWLVAQVIAWAIQHLTITLLELSTVAVIACTGATAFLWFRKPLGVETPTDLYLESSIAQVLLLAGEAAKVPWQDTPLDFVESRINSSQLPLSSFWGVQIRPLP